MIVHLRVLPGFWIAVETCRRPELRSLPVIMGGLPQQRGVVREANYLAQQRGVRAGMTLAQAHQHCPDGIFLVPDLPRYELVWQEVSAVLADFSPLVEPLEMGEALCDLTGSERRWPDPRQAAAQISACVRERTGIVPCLGVATNRLVAQLASLQVDADGITVIVPGQERTFLADLPLTLLPEVDARLALTFQMLGLHTMSQLAALPRTVVKQRFGPLGERLHAYTRGIDPRPIVPPPTRPAISARGECEEGTVEEAVAIIHTLAESCAAELQQQSLAATLVGLTLAWDVSQPELRLLPLPPAQPEAVVPRQSEDGSGKPERTLPISYRIHSMLPQPKNSSPLPAAEKGPHPPIAPMGIESARRDTAQPHSSRAGTSLQSPCRDGVSSPLPGREQAAASPITKVNAIVRTPIATAAPLFERARQLLLQSWPRPPQQAPCLRAIEIQVAEFAQPRQLAFAELGRLDQGGGFAGLDAVRFQALSEQEAALGARYGDTSFRHLGKVDPGNILTERRFDWREGLPWAAAPQARREKRSSRRRRR